MWLAKYLLQVKVEVFWAMCKKKEVKLYCERTEKSTEHRGKLRQLELY
jgi:hypothetical protein